MKQAFLGAISPFASRRAPPNRLWAGHDHPFVSSERMISHGVMIAWTHPAHGRSVHRTPHIGASEYVALQTWKFHVRIA